MQMMTKHESILRVDLIRFGLASRPNLRAFSRYSLHSFIYGDRFFVFILDSIQLICASVDFSWSNLEAGKLQQKSVLHKPSKNDAILRLDKIFLSWSDAENGFFRFDNTLVEKIKGRMTKARASSCDKQMENGQKICCACHTSHVSTASGSHHLTKVCWSPKLLSSDKNHWARWILPHKTKVFIKTLHSELTFRWKFVFLYQICVILW